MGIEAADFTTLYATDIDPACCQTLRRNRDTAAELNRPFLQHAEIVQSCVKELEARDILSSIQLQPGEVDLMIGGPPCQSFSIIGRRNGRNDPNGKLLDEYLRLLAGIQPKVFVFENVKGIKSIEGRNLYKDLLAQMRHPTNGLNYEVSEFCLNASDYGVPQNRERIFLIGSKSGKRIKSIPGIFEHSVYRNGNGAKRRTVADAFRGLPKAESTYPPNHVGRKHSKRIAERYASLNPGERDPMTRINKLDLSKPGYTVVSGSANSGGKGHIHPTKPREVTPRESARIQTFPDWWEFMGTRVSDSRRQIGNAVPPLLAAAIANELRHNMFGLQRVDFPSIVAGLDQRHLALQ